jgi:hypothetical protein
LDFKTLKVNFLNIKNLFNPVLIIDKEEYNLIGYYLLPFANHFTVLFQNQLEDGILRKYLMSLLQIIRLKILKLSELVSVGKGLLLPNMVLITVRG